MTSRITGGTASFEQSRKLAEYENRKASISFAVSADEGEDAAEAVKQALALATQIVLVSLGVLKATPEQAAVIVPDATAEALKKAHAKKLAKAEKEKPKADPAAVGDQGDTPAPVQVGKPDPAEVVEEVSFDPAPAAVTDKDLIDACNKAAGKFGAEGGKRVREIVQKYVTYPKRAQDITAEARPRFIEELAELK